MKAPKWVRRDAVIVVHDRQIELFGGQYGLRNPGLLDSAIARPQQFWFYENADILRLAAAYGYGLCQNHPFLDGNKRTAFVVMVAFLKTNGFQFQAAQVEVVQRMEKLADGNLSETDLVDWLSICTIPLDGGQDY